MFQLLTSTWAAHGNRRLQIFLVDPACGGGNGSVLSVSGRLKKTYTLSCRRTSNVQSIYTFVSLSGLAYGVGNHCCKLPQFVLGNGSALASCVYCNRSKWWCRGCACVCQASVARGTRHEPMFQLLLSSHNSGGVTRATLKTRDALDFRSLQSVTIVTLQEPSWHDFAPVGSAVSLPPRCRKVAGMGKGEREREREREKGETTPPSIDSVVP